MTSDTTETFQIEAQGRPACVEVCGAGDPVILIGAAVPMAWSRPAALALAALGHRVANFDYGPPHGWLGEPLPRTCVDQVADVVAVAEDIGMTEAAAVGLSRGAITAYELAVRHPELVSSLVLAFPVAGFPETIGIVGEEPDTTGKDPLQALDAALDTAFSARFLASNRQAARDLFLSEPGTVIRVAREEEQTVTADTPVAAPTLVLSGGADAVVTSDHPKRLLEAIPQAREHVIPHASHGFVMEEPREFARLVADFLAD